MTTTNETGPQRTRRFCRLTDLELGLRILAQGFAERHRLPQIEALAADFEDAAAAERRRNKTDEEVEAIAERQAKISAKAAALPPGGLATMRLKARVFMWNECAYDLDDFVYEWDAVGGPVLVSLFRDILGDAGVNPAASPEN
jgi:hypothetical protein